MYISFQGAFLSRAINQVPDVGCRLVSYCSSVKVYVTLRA